MFPRKKSKYTKFKLRAKVYSYSIKEYSKGRYMSLSLYKGSKKAPEMFYLTCFNDSVIEDVKTLVEAKKGILNVICSFYIVSKLKDRFVDNQLRVVKIEPTKKIVRNEETGQRNEGFGAINGFNNNKEFF